MPESTFFRGLQPLKFFVFRLFFLFECREAANTKNFEGGRGGQQTNLCVGFLWVFFFAHYLWEIDKGRSKQSLGARAGEYLLL